MHALQCIPVLRIFDEEKARRFYLDWLGFREEFTHRFEPDLPVFIAISMQDVTLYLSEHHGDGTPGGHVHIVSSGLASYQRQLLDKKYKYYRPGLEKTFWNALTMTVQDPFGNTLIFSEPLEKS